MGCKGLNGFLNPKIVDWDLRKDSRQLNSYHMSQVTDNVVKQEQMLILVLAHQNFILETTFGTVLA